MHRKLLNLTLMCALATAAHAQSHPIQRLRAGRSLLGTELQPLTATTQPRTVVAPLDRILPDIIDGGGTSSSITVVNLDSQPADFQLFFLDGSGNLLALPVKQLSDTVNTVQRTVPSAVQLPSIQQVKQRPYHGSMGGARFTVRPGDRRNCG